MKFTPQKDRAQWVPLHLFHIVSEGQKPARSNMHGELRFELDTKGWNELDPNQQEICVGPWIRGNNGDGSTLHWLTNRAIKYPILQNQRSGLFPQHSQWKTEGKGSASGGRFCLAKDLDWGNWKRWSVGNFIILGRHFHYLKIDSYGM